MIYFNQHTRDQIKSIRNKWKSLSVINLIQLKFWSIDCYDLNSINKIIQWRRWWWRYHISIFTLSNFLSILFRTWSSSFSFHFRISKPLLSIIIISSSFSSTSFNFPSFLQFDYHINTRDQFHLRITWSQSSNLFIFILTIVDYCFILILEYFLFSNSILIY